MIRKSMRFVGWAQREPVRAELSEESIHTDCS
jgi:hypothetical protein